MSTPFLMKPHDLPGGGKLWGWIVAIFLGILAFGTFVYHESYKHLDEKNKAEAVKASDADVAKVPEGADVHGNEKSVETKGNGTSSPTGKDAIKVYAHGWLASLYRSLQLFHLHDNHWPDEEGHGGKLSTGWYATGISLARVLAALFALGLPAILLGLLFGHSLKVLRHRHFPGHPILVLGDSDASESLIGALGRQKRNVVRISRRTTRGHHGDNLPFAISGNVDDPDFWINEARADRAEHIVVMEENDAANIRTSLALAKGLDRSMSQSKPLSHVHLADLHLRKGLRSLLVPQNSSPSSAAVYFNRYEIIARLLAQQHPLPTALVPVDDQRQTHYVIVGFGQFGQNVALKLVKMGQQVLHDPDSKDRPFIPRHPRMTIIDRGGCRVLNEFLHSHEGFAETCELRPPVAADCREEGFLGLDFLNDCGNDRVSVIFCLEDEATVVGSILRLLQTPRGLRDRLETIFFRVARPGGVGDLVMRQRGHGPVLKQFASDAEVFEPDLILNLSLDVMAEAIHNAYLTVARLESDPKNPAPAAEKTWDDLDAEERESNREAADHMWAKLRSLGYAVTPGNKSGVQSDASEVAEAIIKKREELASAEHYRWMAWRLISGWTHGAERCNEKKHHPNIVPYEALSEASKDKDRVIVDVIPDLLQRGKLEVRPISRLA